MTTRNEQLKLALEVRYSNVQFVKDIDENRKMFTADDKELVIFKTWEPDTLLVTMDLKELVEKINPNRKGLTKFNKFKELVLLGKLEVNEEVYKKMTIKKMESLQN